MVRTRSLLESDIASPSREREYLSGLLIGAELAGAGVSQSQSEAVWLCGSASMVVRYACALTAVGAESRVMPAEDATVKGVFAVLNASPR